MARGHYDLLYRAEPIVNMTPVVNYQYGMTSDYTPWDQAALGFDMNSQLMTIPNLMVDPSYALNATPIIPTCSSPYRVPSPQEVYQPPMQTQPIAPVSPPVTPPRISAPPPPPITTLPPRSSEGPQIRLNPLVMKSNLSRSLPVTTPFKK